MAAIDLTQLTYGIEIECLIPAVPMAEQRWTVGAYHHGAAIPGHDGWKAMHDASLHTLDYNRQGVEVVSPILRGVEGLESISAMCTTLRAMGASVNPSCGFHVHVGWTGTTRQLRKLIHLVAHHERALYAATGTHAREGNSFCSSIKHSYRPLQQMRSVDAAAHVGRYHVLNLQNLSRASGTVEFRVFAGTTNFTKIAAYVQLCLGLVQKALQSTGVVGWDAPVAAKQQGAGDGQWAVRHLLATLGWYAKGNARALGVLNLELLPVMTAELKRLSSQYDGRLSARQAAAGASEVA